MDVMAHIPNRVLHRDAGDGSDLQTVKLYVNSDESHILLLQMKHTI